MTRTQLAPLYGERKSLSGLPEWDDYDGPDVYRSREAPSSQPASMLPVGRVPKTFVQRSDNHLSH